eukprot:scaffold748_cov251-Pinguiococcus_pyrenoidosus.AAC.68
MTRVVIASSSARGLYCAFLGGHELRRVHNAEGLLLLLLLLLAGLASLAGLAVLALRAVAAPAAASAVHVDDFGHERRKRHLARAGVPRRSRATSAAQAALRSRGLLQIPSERRTGGHEAAGAGGRLAMRALKA